VRFLLDTRLLLWAAGPVELLPDAAVTLLDDPDNELYFSVTSLWEVTIKHGLRRSDFRADPRVLRRELLENGYRELTITSDHATAVGVLPPIHKDPFDRILIAQAMVEAITLLTSDPIIARYPGPIRAV
jgi:PIN domain nuclease of toxin-antitoxin system